MKKPKKSKRRLKIGRTRVRASFYGGVTAHVQNNKRGDVKLEIYVPHHFLRKNTSLGWDDFLALIKHYPKAYNKALETAKR